MASVTAGQPTPVRLRQHNLHETSRQRRNGRPSRPGWTAHLISLYTIARSRQTHPDQQAGTFEAKCGTRSALLFRVLDSCLDHSDMPSLIPQQDAPTRRLNRLSLRVNDLRSFGHQAGDQMQQSWTPAGNRLPAWAGPVAAPERASTLSRSGHQSDRLDNTS